MFATSLLATLLLAAPSLPKTATGAPSPASVQKAHINAALQGGDDGIAAGHMLAALAAAGSDDGDGPAADVDDDALLKRFTKARSALVADLARSLLARTARMEGRLDDAEALYDTLGIPQSLRCVGPFANTGGAAFGSPSPVDDIGAVVAGGVVGLDREVRFQEVPRSPLGTFEITDHFVAQQDVRAFCALVVSSTRAQTIAIRTGASGPLRVVAGIPAVEVLRADEDHNLGFDQNSALVALPAGDTVLVFELSAIRSGGALRVRLTAPDGGRLQATRTDSRAKSIAAARRAVGTVSTSTKLTTLRPPLAILTNEDPEQLALLARVLRQTGAFDRRVRPDLLEATLRRSLQVARNDVQRSAADVALARYLMSRDPSEARALLTAAEARGQQRADVAHALADLHEAQGNTLESARAWRLAIARAPDDRDLLADQLSFERRRDVLDVAVDRAILAAAEKTPTRRLLGLAADVLANRGFQAQAMEKVKRTHNAIRLAALEEQMAEARLGDEPKAVWTILQNLHLRLQLSPDSHHLAERLAEALLAEARLTETPAATTATTEKTEKTEKTAKIGPRPKALKALPTSAAALAEARIARYPERPEPRLLRARLALLAGDREAARADLTAALAIAPDNGDLQKSIRALDDDDDGLVLRHLKPLTDARVQQARTKPPAEAATTGAFIAEKTIAVRYFENGQSQSVEDSVVVVTDARKAQGLRSFPFGYSGGREDLEVLVAERIPLSGRREPAERVVDHGQDGKSNGAYSDARSKVVVFGTLQDGDVLHVRIRKEARGLQNLFGDFFGGVEVVQGRLATRRYQLVIEGPPGRPLSLGGRDVPAPQITLPADSDGVTTTRITMRDIPGLEGQAGMPPWLEVARYVSYSTYSDWGDLGVWYESLIKDQLQLDDELRSKAAAIKAASTSREDLVRRLYEFVVTETRYVGIELGIHGWKPYPVTEVYRRRFGDCKDKASLLVALLREVGVDAHVALVRTIQMGHAGTDPPSMWSFNHAIAWVKELDLFLDGTAEHSGWHELPVMDQGAYALIVDGKDTRLTTIPVAEADANLNTSNYTLHLQPDGALAVVGEEKFRGARNSRERQTFADPATQRQTLERALSQSIPGTEVVTIKVNSTALDNEEIAYRFEAVMPRRAAADGDGSMVMPLSLYPHGLADNYGALDTRRFDLFVDHPWRTRNVMRYVLPAGMKLQSVPPGGEVHGEHLHFVQKVTATEDGFIVDEDTAIVSRRIPIEDYEVFRAQTLQADALMKRKVRIVRGTNTASGAP